MNPVCRACQNVRLHHINDRTSDKSSAQLCPGIACRQLCRQQALAAAAMKMHRLELYLATDQMQKRRDCIWMAKRSAHQPSVLPALASAFSSPSFFSAFSFLSFSFFSFRAASAASAFTSRARFSNLVAAAEAKHRQGRKSARRRLDGQQDSRALLLESPSATRGSSVSSSIMWCLSCPVRSVPVVDEVVQRNDGADERRQVDDNHHVVGLNSKGLG